jgi:anti-sigma B factor antagonist
VEEDFGIVEQRGDGSVTLSVTGEIDVATAPALRERIDGVIEAGVVLVVDLLGVSFLDSTALGVLIAAHKRCEESGTVLRIVVSEPRLVKIFEITGLTELLTIVPTLDQAVGG